MSKFGYVEIKGVVHMQDITQICVFAVFATFASLGSWVDNTRCSLTKLTNSIKQNDWAKTMH